MAVDDDILSLSVIAPQRWSYLHTTQKRNTLFQVQNLTEPPTGWRGGPNCTIMCRCVLRLQMVASY